MCWTEAINAFGGMFVEIWFWCLAWDASLVSNLFSGARCRLCRSGVVGYFFHQIWWSGFRRFDGGLSSLFLHVLSLIVCPFLFLLVLISFVFGCLHLGLRPKHPNMSLALHQGVLLLAQFSVVMFTVEEIRGRWRIQFKVFEFCLRFAWRPSVRLFLWVIYESSKPTKFL